MHSTVAYWTGIGSGSGTLKRNGSDYKFVQYNVSVNQSTWDLSTYAYASSVAERQEDDSYLGSFKPYVDFVQSIDEWKKVGTKAYDGVIQDMLENQPDLNCIITKSGDKHLSVAAGYPFINAKKEQKITIPIPMTSFNREILRLLLL